MRILLLAKFLPEKNEKGVQNEEDLHILNDYIKPVYEACITLGHIVTCETNPETLPFYVDKIDFVFNLYTRVGFRNYEVYISNICNFNKLCCNGAPYYIKTIAEDKVFAKVLAEKLKIATPEWFELSYENPFVFDIPFEPPYFIKPRFGGASIGVTKNSLCSSYKQLEDQFNFLSQFEVDSIVERFVCGPIITVPIIQLREQILYSVYKLETNGPSGIITHEIKKGLDSRFYNIRTLLDDNDEPMAITYALKMFESLSKCKYARFDFIKEATTNKLYFLEFNTCPNIQYTSGFFASFNKKYAINYNEFISYIIASSI